MQDLNWDDLRYVLAVHRGKSYRAAAAKLHVNETTVMRRLRRLETRMGTPIFGRADGTLYPTQLGEQILRRAEAIDVQAQWISEAVAGDTARVAGTVRITAVPWLVNRLLVPRLPSLLADHPELHIDLIAEDADLRARFNSS